MRYILALIVLFPLGTFAETALEPIESPIYLDDLGVEEELGLMMDMLASWEEGSVTSDLVAQRSRTRSVGRRPANVQQERQRILQSARSLAKSGQYEKASQLYFRMSRSPNFRDIAVEAKYILGLMLFELGLPQASGFAFFDVINTPGAARGDGRYVRLALEKLSLVTDQIGSDVLLKYAVSKVRPNSFPQEQRDLFFYRLGDLRLKANDFAEAQRYLGQVPKTSPYYPNARYKQGLALAQLGQVKQAYSAFSDLEEMYLDSAVTIPNRVDAAMGKARVLYQAQDFTRATELYRQIPRDTPQWHQSLFERSWAMVRSGQFRSALSNFQTLHSSYYEDFYIPESLLLRSIIYLYICRYDEMGKVLDLYDRLYKPLHRSIVEALQTQGDPAFYYEEVRKVFDYLQTKQDLEKVKERVRLPYQVLRYVVNDGDISTSLRYLSHLEKELSKIQTLSGEWQNSSVGRYATGIIQRRVGNTRTSIGRYVVRDLTKMRTELRDLSEQGDFLRLEQIGAEKEAIRKEIAGKGLPQRQIDEGAARDYYIQNGFEYWPFRGEYWLDELGNYHYVGLQNCEV